MQHKNLQDITKENIDKLLGQMQVNEHEVILWGVRIGFTCTGRKWGSTGFMSHVWLNIWAFI